jgi:hypothetical protein
MEQLGSANLAIFAQQLLPNPKYLHRPRFPHSKVKGGKKKGKGGSFFSTAA